MYILEKKKLKQVLSAWTEHFDVYVPQKVESYTHFLPFNATKPLELGNPHNTRFPPKAHFLPQSETMLKYNSRLGRFEDLRLTPEPRLLFGARPCDASAVALMDTVFLAEDYNDPYWLARRKATVIVGLGCNTPPHTCFCTTVGGSPFNQAGLDALLTDLGDFFSVQVLTEKAQELFDDLPQATEEQISQVNHVQKKAYESMAPAFETKGLKHKLDLIFESSYWEKIAESCLGCGVCTFLCPTCFCFDIVDEGQRQERIRNWDTCMFRIYTQEASGHNPRPSNKERTRQRLMHKYSYWLDHVGEIGCTGCGRCVRYCPVGLDIRAMLRAASKQESEVVHA